MLICPKCKEKLNIDGRSYVCQNRHCFDTAKSGYVNLLLANQMNSALPGDNKLMVQARKAFLDKGYYASLAEKLCETVRKYAFDGCKILDAGCGEGYYTEKVSAACPDAEIIGIDISKNAADYAARRTKSVKFAVASVFHLPVADESCDIVTTLFAPYCGEEFLRVLKKDGAMVMVIPSERHLWQLKCAVYDEPYLNEVKDFALDGFELLCREKVTREITLPCTEDITALFSMTPYYYKTGVEGQQRLSRLETLTTEIGFEVLAYRKK
ncbi:MAG: methyltransferase domain-containing protein [Oscillospiraceae bacterium]